MNEIRHRFHEKIVKGFVIRKTKCSDTFFLHDDNAEYAPKISLLKSSAHRVRAPPCTQHLSFCCTTAKVFIQIVEKLQDSFSMKLYLKASTSCLILKKNGLESSLKRCGNPTHSRHCCCVYILKRQKKNS